MVRGDSYVKVLFEGFWRHGTLDSSMPLFYGEIRHY